MLAPLAGTAARSGDGAEAGRGLVSPLPLAPTGRDGVPAVIPAPPRRLWTARSAVPPSPTGRPDAILVAGSAVGVVAALLVVGAGAAFQSRVERTLLGSWLDAATSPWRAAGGGFQDRNGFLAAIVLLVVAWSVSGWRVLRTCTETCTRWTTLLLIAPALPFVVSPPFMSKDAYAYVAQGKQLLVGENPYRVGVWALGRSTTVAAVDPKWRGTTSPYGPVALRLQEAVVWASGGREVLALALLRGMVVLCAAGSIVAVRRLAPAHRRARATWLACSPLLLVHVVAPLHLEAVMSLLLLTALVLFTSGRHTAAGALAVCAAEVKVTALIVLACLAVRAGTTLGRRALRRLLIGGFAAAVACGLLLPSDPLGWARGLATPSSGWAPFTPASAVVSVVDELFDVASIGPSAWLIPVVRLGFALVGAVVLLAILRRRRLEMVRTSAFATLISSAAAPVMWPWYLSPGALLLAPSSSWVLPAVLGGTGAFLALPLGTLYAVRVGATAVLAGALAGLLLQRRMLNEA